MSFARGSGTYDVTVGWGTAGLSVAAFVWDGLTPGAGFPGRLALGLVVITAAIFVAARHDRSIKRATTDLSTCVDEATTELSTCVDQSIGRAARFGRDAERRRIEDRPGLAIVRPLVPGNSKGGK